LTIAAEGIDNSQQQAQLLLTGCEQGQGHLFSDPLSAEATAALFVPAAARLSVQRSTAKA
jgi:EAL domain-containing protein (putative c-di-GMP-specific phosphodiesterase class I)